MVDQVCIFSRCSAPAPRPGVNFIKLFFLCQLSNGEYFKITFVIAHRIGDRILRIVECNQIGLHLYSLATNPNTDKPIDI
jgi:hypothetical protein